MFALLFRTVLSLHRAAFAGYLAGSQGFVLTLPYLDLDPGLALTLASGLPAPVGSSSPGRRMLS
jgi:hypothetical protein